MTEGLVPTQRMGARTIGTFGSSLRMIACQHVHVGVMYRCCTAVLKSSPELL
jgi:hypothetical protein